MSSFQKYNRRPFLLHRNPTELLKSALRTPQSYLTKPHCQCPRSCRASRQSMNASAPVSMNASALTHWGTMKPFTMTSHRKMRRRRCARERTENMTTAIVENGFMPCYPLKCRQVSLSDNEQFDIRQRRRQVPKSPCQGLFVKHREVIPVSRL